MRSQTRPVQTPRPGSGIFRDEGSRWKGHLVCLLPSEPLCGWQRRVQGNRWAGLSHGPVGLHVSPQLHPQEHLSLQDGRAYSGADGDRRLASQQQQCRLAQLPLFIYRGRWLGPETRPATPYLGCTLASVPFPLPCDPLQDEEGHSEPFVQKLWEQYMDEKDAYLQELKQELGMEL